MTVSYERQDQILNPHDAANIHISILGCGTVGSWAATCLAKAGFKQFWLADMDIVEDVNLPSQAFDHWDVDTEKVLALDNHLRDIADDLLVNVWQDELTGFETYQHGVIICALDSMRMRRMVFENAARGTDSLFMDFRMGGNILKSWSFMGSDTKRCDQYEKTLHDDSEAAPMPCGGRTFAPVGPLAGAVATQLVTKHLREDDHPPFHIQMDFDRFQSYAIGLKKED